LQRARDRIESERVESSRLAKLYAMERRLAGARGLRVAGLDEVGRGALAGPLTCAAVVLPDSPRIVGLDDSKKLTPSRRESVARQIHECAVAVSVVHLEPARIDSAGMTRALAEAMLQALEGIGHADYVLLDGLPLGLPGEQAVVGGDARVAAIAAASVVAKVARDALMVELAEVHPGYGLSVNNGYGTADHLEALERLGPSPIHRRSFGPCANLRLF
jgi:ribonuclease HII